MLVTSVPTFVQRLNLTRLNITNPDCSNQGGACRCSGSGHCPGGEDPTCCNGDGYPTCSDCGCGQANQYCGGDAGNPLCCDEDQECVDKSCVIAPPPTPPAPPSPPANECQRTTGCNVCSACCQDYIPDGGACDKCVQEKCPHECQPSKGCNVCTACCNDYVSDGDNCNKCVSEQCT